jgi:hypothetical protein
VEVLQKKFFLYYHEIQESKIKRTNSNFPLKHKSIQKSTKLNILQGLLLPDDSCIINMKCWTCHSSRGIIQ